ncbi:hypothetical protein ABU952_10705 [Bacillus amyloliquefaciens]|uniref:hypothetical protein n=1 Tax=Bacillus amyloliquefaciens TaxID=1390 RepID=UPI00336BA7B7
MGKESKVYYCAPKYVVTDREAVYVHPIKHINREHIRYVPRHVYQEETIHEVVDPGDLGKCECKKIKKDTDGNWFALSQVKHAS